MKTALLSALLVIATEQKVQYPSARAILFKTRTGDYPGEYAGVIDFWQEDGAVRLNGTVSGLAARKHGFHVHENGDISNGCLAAGNHYNPATKDHGAQDASIRHHGDLGNILAPDSGMADISTRDTYLSLNGQYSIIGRAIVVHEMEDDLGLGGNDASKKNGNAGARVACGVIAVMEDDGSSAALFPLTSTIFVTLAYFFAQ